jgi:hypothetical protein
VKISGRAFFPDDIGAGVSAARVIVQDVVRGLIVPGCRRWFRRTPA